MEKYSVLMSLYKNEKPEYLRLALDSMINQSVKPDEIILVEDGPLTDELHKVVEEYKGYLKLVINEENLGLGLALQKGLNACRNELVARMDTDDISVLDRCEKQLSFFMAHPEITIVGGQIDEFISNPQNVIGRRVVPETDEDLKAFMKRRCPFNHMTVMFRKSDVIKVGNYQDWYWNEDYYLWIRLALGEFKFANLADTLVYTRVGPDMYRRRGGIEYFNSEKRIQRLLFETRVITFPRYLINVLERMTVQVLMPNWLRGIVFRTFARS